MTKILAMFSAVAAMLVVGCGTCEAAQCGSCCKTTVASKVCRCSAGCKCGSSCRCSSVGKCSPGCKCAVSSKACKCVGGCKCGVKGRDCGCVKSRVFKKHCFRGKCCR